MQLCMADTQITFNNEYLFPILDPHGHHLLSIVTKSRHMEKSPTWLLFSWMIKNYSICVSRSNSFTIWCIDIYLEESFVGQHSLNVCMGPMPWGLGRIESFIFQVMWCNILSLVLFAHCPWLGSRREDTLTLLESLSYQRKWDQEKSSSQVRCPHYGQSSREASSSGRGCSWSKVQPRPMSTTKISLTNWFLW